MNYLQFWRLWVADDVATSSDIFSCPSIPIASAPSNADSLKTRCRWLVVHATNVASQVCALCPPKVACHSSGMTAKIMKKHDTTHSDYLPHWFLTFKCHGNFGLRTTDWRAGAQLYTLALYDLLYAIHFLECVCA